MRCPCATHRAEYDRRYVRRIDGGWPRWLAWLVGAPASAGYEKARENVRKYDRAHARGLVGFGFLGGVICDDQETAQKVTQTLGMRSWW